MVNAIVPAGLEDIVEADDIALDISVRILDAVPHARLCRQIDHHRRRILRENPCHRLLPRNAVLHEHKIRIPLQPPQPLLLDIDIVIICH